MNKDTYNLLVEAYEDHIKELAAPLHAQIDQMVDKEFAALAKQPEIHEVLAQAQAVESLEDEHAKLTNMIADTRHRLAIALVHIEEKGLDEMANRGIHWLPTRPLEEITKQLRKFLRKPIEAISSQGKQLKALDEERRVVERRIRICSNVRTLAAVLAELNERYNMDLKIN